MLTDAPDPLEIANFRFCQMRKLCVNQDNEKIPAESINLVAASSRYGLVFVGLEGGFKVLKLENIFDLNEDEEKRKEAKEFQCQKVASPTPCLLSLSADDMTLAVCVTRDSCAVADMYDIRVFADQEEVPLPFTSVRLSSDNNVKLRDLMWNPVVVEMYAFCLTDGSMFVHEIAEANLKISANLPPQTNATAVCWSPKGKEVVVGKKNGTFSRFKPTLQEVKSFPPPPAGLDENGVEVVSIFWISTTLFAVVYVPAGSSDDKSPSLVFVSKSKGADITYSNFGDVCYGSVCEREPRYMMHYDPEWKILVCVSSNAIESAVIGCSGDDKSVWQQWMLDDSGRAEIPLVRNMEPSPLGMAVIYCAQRKIIISETECYPPMPILFLLSTSGSLCPFHMLNTGPSATNLVYPSEPINREGERKRKDNSKAQPVLEIQQPSSSLTSAGHFQKIVQPQSDTFPANSNIIPSVSSVPVNSTSVLPAQSSVVQNTPLDNMKVFITPEINSFSFVPSQSNQKILSTPKIAISQNFDSLKPSVVSPSQAFASVNPFSVIPSSGANPVFAQSSVPQVTSSDISSAEQSSKKFAVAAVTHPPVQTVARNSQLPLISISTDQKSAVESIKVSESSWTTESTIVNAVLEEVAEFARELKELKERSSKCEVLIGAKEEMSYLKKSSLSLVEFHQKMNFAIETLSSEVHSLKNMVLESYAMLSEAESQEKRLKDPKYVSMLRERSLDPRSAKQMQKIQQLNQYLSTQLSEVNDKLDNDWHEFVQQQQNNNRRKAHQLPSAEAIYRTIVSNQNIIYNQKAQLERMVEALSRRRREGQLRGVKLFHSAKIEISDDELGKLADALLQTKISGNNGKMEILHTARKTIPLQKQAALRELLANRRVTAVKPTVIYCPSQSRLCSTLPVASVDNKGIEKPPGTDVREKDGKLENMEHLSLRESFPEGSPSYSTHLEMTSIPPFSAKAAIVESKRGITQGIPMTKTLSKPTPSIIPTQALSPGTISVAFKTVQNGYFEPQSSSLLTKNSSQSAFTHLVPTASKPVPESPKLPSQISAGKPSFGGQNLSFQQKAVSSSSFVSMLNPRPGPERSFVPAFTFSETKEVGSVNSAFSQSPLCSSSAVPETENLGSCIYEDISPPDSPHLTDEECEAVQLPTQDKLSVQNLPVKDTSETSTVQPTCEEKLLVTKPATDLKSPSFFFSPVSEKKPEVTSPISQKDVLQSHEGDVPLKPTAAKCTEISISSSPAAVSVSSSDNPRVGSATSVSQQNSSLSLSISGIPVTSVPSTLASGLVSATQVMVSSPADSIGSPTVSVIHSSASSNKKQISSVATQAESPFAAPKIGESVATGNVPLSSQPLQPNLGKMATFTFALPVKDQSNQKDVKNLDTETSSTVVPSNTMSTPNLVVSSEGQSATISAETSVTSQKAIFGTVSSSTSSSSVEFEQVASVTSPPASASTTSAQSLFGKTSPVNSSTSSGAFGLTAATPSSSSSIFGQKTVSTATTTSSVGTAATTATNSTLPFFGQQSTSQSSFFGKTTLTSPVFGQAPQTQSSVFGQTVSSASSPSFGQTASGSFFSQSPTTSGTSVFGQKAQSPSGSSAFGQSTGASGFSFQKASMEQQSSGSFGLTKSVFGQNPVFGQQQQQNTSFSFDQSSPSSGGVFGQGSFFSGLGGKPSEENASKNVFASTLSSPAASTGIFGNQGASSFGTKLGGSFSGGSFSSGSGTVAQSGFGAFQQTPQKTSGFGAPPSFGGSPSFGSSPNFGGSPTFGSGIGTGGTLGGSTFGSTQAEGFGSFASSNSPTFGSLASQTGGFSGAAQQQTATFGSLSPQSPPSAFGGVGPLFGGSPGFGAQSNFGNPTNAAQSSAFSQWRN